MPLVRIFLESLAHAGMPSGRFDTFVSLAEDELTAGNHVRAAMRRATIRGFEAPYRVVEIRTLGLADHAEGYVRPRGEGRRADGAVLEELPIAARLGAA